jgi:signal transduction histidine kinase
MTTATGRLFSDEKMVVPRQLIWFSRCFWLTLGMFAVFATTFGLYAFSEKKVDRANEARQRSYLLAGELRQSSDDLTRMVRTYVVTGAPIYKEHYQEILDIRDGKKPRPADYHAIYWDLVLADDLRPRPSGPAVPLLDLMRRAGFTEVEFASLAQAKANSDALTDSEFAAMALIESANPPADARARAIRMLHDAFYHQAKAAIMRPINEFDRIADQRTGEAVHAAKAVATRMRAALILFGVLLISLLWSTRRSLYAILGGSVNELYTRIVHLGRGNFSSVISVPARRDNSVLGWLSETQTNLARIDAQRRQAEEEVGIRTKELNESAIASLNMMEDAVRHRAIAEQSYVKLEQTHKQLLEASHQRGRAEVATSVLHNVGNVLNSVNVSASLVVESVSNSRAASLAKVVALMREHEAQLGRYITSDPRGKHIPAVLEQLAQEWLEQQQTVVKELESLRANIDHIKEIVAMQQSHAKVAGSAEIVNVRDLVEDSLRLNASALLEAHIRVVRDFEEVPQINVEKHKVLQILVNLVLNAKHACDALGDIKKRMTLRISQVDGRIRISVSDNGVGIAAENLTRIFAHGFTTRKDGHGFGLHSGALAATEMGGSLSAHSDGPCKGATFTLELARHPSPHLA